MNQVSLDQIRRNIAALDADGDTRPRCIGLTTGAMCPPTLSHVSLFVHANRMPALQDGIGVSGCVLVGSFMSPSSDKYYVEGKLSDCPFFFNAPDRLRMCEEAMRTLEIQDSTFTSSWESDQDGFFDFPDVVEHFRNQMDRHDDLRPLRLVYVCGSDHYVRMSYLSSLRDVRLGVCCVVRHGYPVPEARPHAWVVHVDERRAPEVFHSNPMDYEIGGVPAIQVSSTLVRKRIIAGKPIWDLVGRDVARLIREKEVAMRVPFNSDRIWQRNRNSDDED